MNTPRHSSPLDGLPPEIQAAIRAYVEQVVADAPPFTEEQKRLLKSMFDPRLVSEVKPGDAA